jgi:hypothetical protein
MTRLIITLVLTLLIDPSFAEQGGSFYLSDLRSLLAGNIAWQGIKDSFDIYSAGDASRIGWSESNKLGGTRIGPYKLWAKPKGRSGPYTCGIDIKTRISYLDKFGQQAKMENATSVKEEVVAFEIRTLTPKEYLSPPP